MKNLVSDSIQIIALPNGKYRGIWSGYNVFVPFDNYPNTDYNYEFQTYDALPGKGTPCSVIIDDFSARVNVLETANYSGSVIDGKLILSDK